MRAGKIALLGLVASAVYLLISAVPADAQIANIAMAELYISIQEASKDWLQRAGQIALQLLAVTAVIGFAIGMKDLVLAGNVTLDGIVAMLVRYAMLIGLLVWLLNAPQRLALIPMSIKKIGATISGQNISFGGLIRLFADVTNPLVDFTRGLGWTDVGLIICMTFIIFLINCLFFLIATTVLVVEIEAIFIMVGGLFTASFFIIGYFRDSFMSYIKALASVGVKMLMLCLCLGAMRNIMATWPAMISIQVESTESVFSFLMPMACALMGFYMILKAVPQFASSILTGSSSWLDGGALKGAAMAGYALGATVVNSSWSMAQKMIGGASVVSQAAQTYQHTSQAARDTGSTPNEAKAAGAKEAVATVMTGPQVGGSRAAGERIYSDHQRGQQFADVRAGASSNMMSQPASSSTRKDEKK
ncbi:type IV secretion system protein [Synergistaceae bacterium OttesenSCG-928-I11]|nr:type IV secretion system protein [Synergistaceae bacterium OttesenSCG-928-I11]